jgi:hypothetical protein
MKAAVVPPVVYMLIEIADLNDVDPLPTSWFACRITCQAHRRPSALNWPLLRQHRTAA